jgi:hypothetical protein
MFSTTQHRISPGNTWHFELDAEPALLFFEDVAAWAPQSVIVDVGIVVDPGHPPGQLAIDL